MIHSSRGKSEADMKVELLIGCDLKGRSEVQEVLRCAALRKLGGVLDKCVPPIRVLAVEQETGLSS